MLHIDNLSIKFDNLQEHAFYHEKTNQWAVHKTGDWNSDVLFFGTLEKCFVWVKQNDLNSEKSF
jgi:hypothetical protein